MRHNIEFVGRLRGKTLSELAAGEPVKLASRLIPEWRAKQKRSFTLPNGNEQVTAKYCVGIHDFSRAGYIIPAWQDFKFRFHSSDPDNFEIHSPQIVNKINHDHDVEIAAGNGMGSNVYMNKHEYQQAEDAPFLDHGCKSVIKIMSPWSVCVPKGVSLLYCHPFFHISQSDYSIVPGIVDADMDMISNREVNIFVKLNKPDDVITIKKGDPLCQVIPFVRADYELTVDTVEVHEVDQLRYTAQATFDSVVHADSNRKLLDEDKWSPLKTNMIHKEWDCPHMKKMQEKDND